MKKHDKEVQQAFLDEEKRVLAKLEDSYEEALIEINNKIEMLMARNDADLQHVIYQIEYQRALKTQVQATLENLQANEFETVSEYLTNSYTNGYIGAMYSMHQQGVPLIIPIDQSQVVEAIKHDTKLSTSLYTALGHDIKDLQKKISSEISRGIATGQGYGEIARNIAAYSKVPLNNAMRIARTESHRIQCKSAMDAQYKAKEKGADVVKQWDAALDGKTRPHHRKLDGQIRELDEPFEVGGKKAMFPGDFGDPAEDCNCRCALLQIPRWALDDEELENLKERAEYFGLDKTKDFEEYKKKYLKAAESDTVRSDAQKTQKVAETLENTGKNGIIEVGNDIYIPRSVGAKGRNYDIELPNKEIVHLTEGTRITNINVIAGKGRNRAIDEVDILLDRYGGSESEWQKKKGLGYVDYEGESYHAELHWYEEPTVGRHEWKVKPDADGNWFIDD